MEIRYDIMQAEADFKNTIYKRKFRYEFCPNPECKKCGDHEVQSTEYSKRLQFINLKCPACGHLWVKKERKEIW